MTEEQIKQNAEQYALKKTLISTDSFHGMVENYLAGAHSRDEEIEELQKDVHNLEQALSFAEDVADIQRKELDKLRNPWISVKKRLPEKIKNKGISKHVFVIWPDGTHGEAYYNYEEYKAPRWEIKGAGIIKPAYWMPIPETPKEKEE